MAVWTVIDHQELGASEWAPSGSTTVASWEKTSIPTDGTYDHLLIKASLRGEKTGTYYDSLALTVNGITSSVYSNTAVFANSSTVATTRESARGELVNAWWPGDDNTDNTFGSMNIWIPHYANITNFKSFVIDSTSENASASDNEWRVGIMAGLYNQNTAISSVKIASNNGTDLSRYSTVTLIGIKGA